MRSPDALAADVVVLSSSSDEEQDGGDDDTSGSSAVAHRVPSGLDTTTVANPVVVRADWVDTQSAQSARTTTSDVDSTSAHRLRTSEIRESTQSARTTTSDVDSTSAHRLRTSEIRERREKSEREKQKQLAAGTCTACVLLTMTCLYYIQGCGGLDCGPYGQCTGGLSFRCVCEGNLTGDFCDRCEGNYVGELCESECGCSGKGIQTGIEAARAAGTCSAGSCACEGNWVGEFCERSCGAHGTSDGGHTCACERGYVGQLCEYGPDVYEPVDCVGNWLPWGLCDRECGNGQMQRYYHISTPAMYGGVECNVMDRNNPRHMVQAYHHMSESKSCMIDVCPPPPEPMPEPAPEPAPEPMLQDTLPWNRWTVPSQCLAGMGRHGVVYNGTAYRTLDGAPPEGPWAGGPNYGRQNPCMEYYVRALPCTRREQYLGLPLGYALAPPDADTIAVIAAHGWSTVCAVTANGEAWYSGNSDSWNAGNSCGGGYLSSSGHGSFTTALNSYFNSRVLARCP